MDSFFEYDFNWDDFNVDPFPVKQSAFVPYINQRSDNGLPRAPGPEKKKSMMNVKNRMVEFLKKNWTAPVVSAIGISAAAAAEEAEKERNRRHMMNERMRREKEKQNYNRLRKLLPHHTKRDKKSIVQMAARQIEEMESYKAKLEKKNKELLLLLENNNNNNNNNRNVVKSDEKGAGTLMEEAKIKIRVGNPSSAIDSMLEVLYCLRNNGAIPTSIQSNFSPSEFSSLLQIKTSIKAAEVENAVQKTLYEVERKFRCPNMDLQKHTSAPIIK